MNPPAKDAIADVLESIARLLELKGENPFKIRAYTNAARAVIDFPGDLPLMAREGRLDEIPGIGSHIAEKITELVTTGELKFYVNLKAEFPAGLFELFELPFHPLPILHELFHIPERDFFGRLMAENLLQEPVELGHMRSCGLLPEGSELLPVCA